MSTYLVLAVVVNAELRPEKEKKKNRQALCLNVLSEVVTGKECLDEE